LETCRRVCDGIDYVLHEAALGSVPRSVEDPLLSNECNVTGTLNMLVAARDAAVKRFVFAASSSAYGDTPTLPKIETMTPRPLSPYALTKLVGEEYCRIFAQLYDLETVALRYFNVFGRRQDPFSTYAAVIPKFAAAILKGKRSLRPSLQRRVWRSDQPERTLPRDRRPLGQRPGADLQPPPSGRRQTQPRRELQRPPSLGVRSTIRRPPRPCGGDRMVPKKSVGPPGARPKRKGRVAGGPRPISGEPVSHFLKPCRHWRTGILNS
jgi:hypothetical protein